MGHDYGKAMTSFWDTTGKALNGNTDALALALYFISNRHANGIGLYYIPLQYIVFDLGLTEKRAWEAIMALHKAGWLCYDRENGVVWVQKMAYNEVSDPNNEKRQKWVQAEFDRQPKSVLSGHWLNEYRDHFDLYPHGLSYCSHIDADGKIQGYRDPDNEDDEDEDDED